MDIEFTAQVISFGGNSSTAGVSIPKMFREKYKIGPGDIISIKITKVLYLEDNVVVESQETEEKKEEKPRTDPHFDADELYLGGDFVL